MTGMKRPFHNRHREYIEELCYKDRSSSSSSSSSEDETKKADIKSIRKKKQKLDSTDDHHDNPRNKTPILLKERPISGKNINSATRKELALMQHRHDHQQHPVLDLIPVRRLFEEGMSTQLSNDLKTCMEPSLRENLKQLLERKPDIEVGLKMARTVYLLQLISPFNDEFEEVGNKAGKGVRLLQEGLCLLNEAKDLLRSVINKFDSID